MLGAIGTSAIASAVSGGTSAAGLEAQLAQYEVKLADWSNCPSCKTEEGKAKIAEFSAKVSEIKQRIAVVAANKAASASASGREAGILGRRLDVFA